MRIWRQGEGKKCAQDHIAGKLERRNSIPGGWVPMPMLLTTGLCRYISKNWCSIEHTQRGNVFSLWSYLRSHSGGFQTLFKELLYHPYYQHHPPMALTPAAPPLGLGTLGYQKLLQQNVNKWWNNHQKTSSPQSLIQPGSPCPPPGPLLPGCWGPSMPPT